MYSAHGVSFCAHDGVEDCASAEYMNATANTAASTSRDVPREAISPWLCRNTEVGRAFYFRYSGGKCAALSDFIVNCRRRRNNFLNQAHGLPWNWPCPVTQTNHTPGACHYCVWEGKVLVGLWEISCVWSHAIIERVAFTCWSSVGRRIFLFTFYWILLFPLLSTYFFINKVNYISHLGGIRTKPIKSWYGTRKFVWEWRFLGHHKYHMCFIDLKIWKKKYL